jgi:GMP synthase-like glutamine amidotransferase
VRALVIQHDHICLPGAVGERLTERGFVLVQHQVVEADRFDEPGVDTNFPDPADFDAIIALGAPWSAYDHAAIGSWVLPELEMLRRADAAAVPVLGICFGGQLLALAHGGGVASSPDPELGWAPVQSVAEDLVASGPWFQWHYDRWTTPPEATELARNAQASQAFLIGRNLAVQFHPEMTPEILAGWFAAGGKAHLDRFQLDEAQLTDETRLRAASNQQRAARLVDGFLDRVATGRAAEQVDG